MAGKRVGQCMSTAYREAARGVCVTFSGARSEIARSSFSERGSWEWVGDCKWGWGQQGGKTVYGMGLSLFKWRCSR